MSGRDLPRFAGVKTFFRLPHVSIDENFDVALFGVPFDGGLSYRPGARFAPTKVRELSSLGRAYHWSREVDLFKTLRIADVGDCPVVPVDLKSTYDRIEKYVGKVVDSGKKFVAVGGDHSVTLPLLRAVKKKMKSPLCLIHFDAHLDTYPAAWEQEYHHGSFLRHAIEEGLIDPKKSFQIGLRGPLAGGEDKEFVTKHGLRGLTIDDIRDQNLSSVLASLPTFVDLPTYITFDVDCLDPVYAPGTGTPVVGGLTTYEVQRILRSLKVKNLVGGDIVEISPPYDHADLTTLVGVDVMFEMLCLMAEST